MRFFALGCLGSSSGIFWNNLFILKTYILKRYFKLCSKDFSQQPMKYMVAPSKTNYSVVEFDGSGQPPPLLPLSCSDGCYFSWASIEHKILYILVISFLINPSDTFPCNFLQIDVLYQGQPVVHYELWLSISYCNCSCVSIIHNIPTWCNIVFNTKFVITSWYVVFKLSTSIIVSFPRLLHPIAIFLLYFSQLPPEYTNI